MTPVVLEQYGRTAPGAQAIFNRIIYHRLQLLVRQGTPYSFAKRTASSELWGPISCTVMRAAWQAHAECTPRVGLADLGIAADSLPERGRTGGSVGCNGWNESMAKSLSSSSCCCLCFFASGSVGEDVVVGSCNATSERLQGLLRLKVILSRLFGSRSNCSFRRCINSRRHRHNLNRCLNRSRNRHDLSTCLNSSSRISNGTRKSWCFLVMCLISQWSTNTTSPNSFALTPEKRDLGGAGFVFWHISQSLTTPS